MKTQAVVVAGLCAILLTPTQAQNQATGGAAARPVAPASRTVRIPTTEVTAPALAVAPDDQSLIFSALGHILQVPVAGGATTQLTTGVSYDTDPAVSPDGRRLAFTSNRDGSGSNIFVMDLATKRVTQLTREVEATRAAWSPDGQTIAYARTIPREDHPLEMIPGFADTSLRELRTVPAAGGQPTVVGKELLSIETIFYLSDGSLGWSYRDIAAGGMMGPTVRQTMVAMRGPNGQQMTVGTFQGDVGRVVPGPKGDGVYSVGGGGIRWMPFGPNSTATPGPRMGNGRIAINRDGSTVYFGDQGGLWRATLPNGTPQRIPFTATVAVDVMPRVDLKWTSPASAPATASLRPVLAPTLSRDGKRLAVMAAGLLFEQALTGAGTAQQLVAGGAFTRDPTYSPDGTKLAYVASENGKRTLRVYDFSTKQTKTLFTTGGAAWPLHPSWSPDGQRIVFQHAQNLGQPFPIMLVTVSDGAARQLTQTVGSWVARPHFSGDGQWVYFTNRSGKIGDLNRIGLADGAKPEALTQLTRHVHEGLVSPDGKWLAHRRNSEVWIVPMGAAPIRDAGLRRLSAEGGRSFSFTPDSSAIVYTSLGKVWKQPIAGGVRTEVPVRISVPRAVAPPLLVRNVKVLDLAAGRFGDNASILVQNGRIQWIGSEQGKQIPADVVRVDGAGRYAIPGLFDSHVHSAWQNNQTNEDSFIAFGVTSVRDTGSSIDPLTALDDRANVTALPAPRYFYSGEIFEGTMPLWGDAFSTVGTEQEARAEVRMRKAAGADFVKIYPSVPWFLQGVIADEAHKVGLPIVGHGLSPEEVIRRVVWGSTSLEHGNGVTGVFEDVHKLLAAAGTAVDLTLSVGGGNLMRAGDPDWQTNWRVLEYVPAESRAGGGGGRGRGGPPQTREQMLAGARGQFERISTAHTRGVPMMGGTDALMGGVFFGLSLHWEIAQFVDAGVPTIDALRMATEGGAKLVGASADLGSLTPGKLADIVLLEASPLENIRNTQKIWQVIKGGHVYDPTKIRPSIETTAGR